MKQLILIIIFLISGCATYSPPPSMGDYGDYKPFRERLIKGEFEVPPFAVPVYHW
jgi:hypothetical protein